MKAAFMLPPAVLLLQSVAFAQLLRGVTVGLTTSPLQINRVCNVLNSINTADDGDIGKAIQRAFDTCANRPNSLLYLPPGNYYMKTWVSLSDNNNWAFKLDGTIFRDSDATGHMILFNNVTNFEFYSSTAASNGGGAIQGWGYKLHKLGKGGARLVRICNSKNFYVHHLKLIDSPEFHLIIDNGKDSLIHDILIRGGNKGGLDGIDVEGSNIHIHRVEVSNRDECVTVKNPSSNLLIENIYCNWSGGCAMGSLWENTKIRNIHYRNVYTRNSNQMFMIKSAGGNGNVNNVLLENFIGHTNAYTLNIDQYWKPRDDTPVTTAPVIRNLFLKNWYASHSSSNNRPTFLANCVPSVSCAVSATNVNVWRTDGGTTVQRCKACRGRFACAIRGRGSDSNRWYTTRQRLQPRNLATLPEDLNEGLGIDKEIPIRSFPQRYFPASIYV